MVTWEIVTPRKPMSTSASPWFSRVIIPMLLSRAVNIYIILTYMYFNRCYLLIMRFEYLQEKFLIFLDFFFNTFSKYYTF